MHMKTTHATSDYFKLRSVIFSRPYTHINVYKYIKMMTSQALLLKILDLISWRHPKKHFCRRELPHRPPFPLPQSRPRALARVLGPAPPHRRRRPLARASRFFVKPWVPSRLPVHVMPRHHLSRVKKQSAEKQTGLETSLQHGIDFHRGNEGTCLSAPLIDARFELQFALIERSFSLIKRRSSAHPEGKAGITGYCRSS